MNRYAQARRTVGEAARSTLRELAYSAIVGDDAAIGTIVHQGVELTVSMSVEGAGGIFRVDRGGGDDFRVVVSRTPQNRARGAESTSTAGWRNFGFGVGTMSTPRELHLQAMALYEASIVAAQAGDRQASAAQLREAADLEREAAEMLKPVVSSEPTRGVLFRSAATLFRRLEDIAEAERLAFSGLSGFPKEPVRTQLRTLVEELGAKSARGSTPSWDALVAIRASVWPDNVEVHQVLPALSPAGDEYVNIAECLHLHGPIPWQHLRQKVMIVMDDPINWRPNGQ